MKAQGAVIITPICEIPNYSTGRLPGDTGDLRGDNASLAGDHCFL